MQASRRRTPITAHWAAALVALSLGGAVYFQNFGVWLTFAPFAPLLGAWLGARYGRGALSALFLAAPLIAPAYWLQLTEISQFDLGVGLETWVLTGFAIAAFDKDRPLFAEAPPAAHEGAGLALALMLALAASASLETAGGALGARLAVEPSTAVPVAVFLLIASGRASALAAIGAAVVVSLLAYAVALWFPLPLVFEPGIDGPLSASIAWGRDTQHALGAAIPAAVAGLLYRPLWRDGTALDVATGSRALVLAGIAAAFLLPLATWGVATAADAWREARAAPLADAGPTAPGAAIDADADPTLILEAIVVTVPRVEPTAPMSALPLGAAWFMTLGGFAFAAGGLWPRRASAALPALYAAATFTVLALDQVISGAWADAATRGSPFLDLLGDSIDVVALLALFGWSFAWLGGVSTAYARAARGGAS
jgi:hypothetical protein